MWELNEVVASSQASVCGLWQTEAGLRCPAIKQAEQHFERIDSPLLNDHSASRLCVLEAPLQCRARGVNDCLGLAIPMHKP
jgi:hypothetical protein